MKAHFREGPADGAACEVPDPPPHTLRVETFAEDVDQSARPVQAGEEFPEMKSKAHGYRFDRTILTEVGQDPASRTTTAHYVFDDALDPELAGNTVVVEAGD